jgi:hypothetical protein
MKYYTRKKMLEVPLSLGATLGLGYAFLRSYLAGRRRVETTVVAE